MVFLQKNTMTHPLRQPWLLLLFVLMGVSSCRSKKQVSLILHGGKIYTVDSGFRVVEAMAVDGDKIIAVGSNEEILGAYASDSILDVQGDAVFPGFIDAHCHFTGYAADSWKCDLTGTTSFSDVLERIRTYAAQAPQEWIYGRGWDQNDWADKQFPDKSELDRLFPDRPVLLKRVDGHAVLVNQKALDLAGLRADTRIHGGTVVVAQGKMTGLLIDNAIGWVERLIPEPVDSLKGLYMQQLQQRCFALGLTGVHDCGVSEGTVELVDREQRAGRLKMKIYALLTDSAQYYDKWLTRGPLNTGRLKVHGFKLYADGALGSRGACLLHDYHDQPGWRGFLLSDTSHFRAVAKRLYEAGWQMCTHAIGDSGNRTLLEIYGNWVKAGDDRRWRIEHAQVVDTNDRDRFGRHGIIPSVQPTHATSDMYWAEERLGAGRMKGAYAYRSLLRQNGWMPLGTDFPVEDISPFRTFHAAVVRTDAKGYPKGGFRPEEGLSREETLRGMTIWAARAAFEEREKGSLEPGKQADFIILDTDLMRCPEDRILESRVKATFVNGERVWRGMF